MRFLQNVRNTPILKIANIENSNSHGAETKNFAVTRPHIEDSSVIITAKKVAEREGKSRLKQTELKQLASAVDNTICSPNLSETI